MKKYLKILSVTILFFPLIIQGQNLDDYLKKAAKNNPGLKAKYAQYEAAMQKIKQANSLPDPVFSFGYFISSVETRVGPQQARLGLSQMFPWFGTLAAKGEMATLIAESKYQIFLNAENELYYKVKAAWYPLYEVSKVLILQKENREILSSYEQLSTTGFKNGKNTMVDVIRVGIMIENTDTDIKLLEEKMKPLLIHFNRLLNRSDSIPVEIPEVVLHAEPELNYRKDSLLSANPMIASFDLKIKSIESQEEFARKQGLPNFGVGIDYVIVGNRSGVTISDNGKDALMPMISMSLPIFRGKYKAAVKEAQFMQTAMAESKADFENNLVSSYEMQWYKLNKANHLIELYQKQESKTKQVIDLIITAYSNSGKDFEEVLRMQQELLKYQIAEATAIKNYYTALAKLDYITAKKY
ncbi:MAG: TolC family protein [Bacteroidetes bacterium]|nr:TolC family protein [Bacteroidota bacterium]